MPKDYFGTNDKEDMIFLTSSNLPGDLEFDYYSEIVSDTLVKRIDTFGTNSKVKVYGDDIYFSSVKSETSFLTSWEVHVYDIEDDVLKNTDVFDICNTNVITPSYFALSEDGSYLYCTNFTEFSSPSLSRMDLDSKQVYSYHLDRYMCSSHVEVVGSIVYMSCLYTNESFGQSSRILIVDYSNPEQPNITSSFEINGASQGFGCTDKGVLVENDNIAYYFYNTYNRMTFSHDVKIDIIDVSNIESPVRKSTLLLGVIDDFSMENYQVVDKTLYIVNNDGELEIWDVENPANPQLIKNLTLMDIQHGKTHFFGCTGIYSVSSDKNRLYIEIVGWTFTLTFAVLEITDRQNPILLAEYYKQAYNYYYKKYKIQMTGAVEVNDGYVAVSSTNMETKDNDIVIVRAGGITFSGELKEKFGEIHKVTITAVDSSGESVSQNFLIYAQCWGLVLTLCLVIPLCFLSCCCCTLLICSLILGVLGCCCILFGGGAAVGTGASVVKKKGLRGGGQEDEEYKETVPILKNQNRD